MTLVGETLSLYEPAAGEATYQAASGEPVFTYASSADGPFGATKPQQKGTWYMRAAVAQADDYEALVSAPVAFEIKPATLDNANVWRIGWEATTDQATPLSLTEHAYWNLNGAASGTTIT